MESLKKKILLLQENKNIYFGLNGEIYSEDKNAIIHLEHIEDKRLDLKGIINEEGKADKLRLGAIGELYAQYIMKSFGYKVFPAIVDDHGVDLVIIKDEKPLKIQVKTVNAGTYVYFHRKKFDLVKNEDYFIMYIRINNNGSICTYIYPSIIWNNITKESDWKKGLFSFYAYKEEGSKPEYGISGAPRYYENEHKELSKIFCISKENNDWELDKDKFEDIINNPKEKIKDFFEAFEGV